MEVDSSSEHATGEVVPPRDPNAAIDELRRKAAARTGVVTRRKPIAAVVAAVLVCVGVFAGVFWMTTRVLPLGRSSAPASADDSADPEGRAAAANTTAGTPHAPRSSSATNATGDHRKTGTASREQGDGLDTPASDAAPLNTRAADPSTGRPAAGATSPSAAASPVVAPATPLVDDAIYSDQDRDVIPPHTSERLPAPTLRPGATRVNTMEFIVSPTGAVERVRFLGLPQRMVDGQMLGWAKLWKFTPAMKDGKPVRYRLHLTWEVNP